MKNLELLFNGEINFNNHDLKIKEKDCLSFELMNKSITGSEIFEMINRISKTKLKKIRIKFEWITFNDGLVPHFLDLIIYYIIKNNFQLEYKITVRNDEKIISGLDSYINTAINNYQNQYSKKYISSKKRSYSSNKPHKRIKNDFLSYFKNPIIEKNGFLRLFIDRDIYDNSSDYIYLALERLIRLHELDEDIFLDLDDVLNEVIGNVLEKTTGDILINLFINDVVISSTKQATKMLEVAIISLQESTIDEDVRTFYMKLENEEYDDIEEDILDSYKKLQKHFTIHKSLFDETYSEKNFYAMCAFNERVTSREKSFGKAGGTGLPSLIDRINTNKEDVIGFSYMYSGENIVWFRKNRMNLSDKIFSYNSENDIYKKPDEITYGNAHYLPGIAYNLVFPL